MNSEEHGIEINLVRFARKLFENIGYVILVTAIFAILGFVGSKVLTTPYYQATVKMMVNSRNDDSANITNDQLNSSRNLVETYAVIILGRNVLNQVIDELDLQESYEQLANLISVKSVNNTPVMKITVKHTDRDTALQIATKILKIAPKMLVDTTEAGSVKEVEAAYASDEPVSTGVMKKTVLMTFFGLAASCLAVFVLMLMDNTYKMGEDVQRDFEIPVLGIIPDVESCRRHSTRKKTKTEEGAK